MSLLSMMATFPDADIADIRSEGNEPGRASASDSSSAAASPVAPATDSATGPALYVATDLRAWATDRPHWFRANVQIDGTAYRRLDPEYYAWLRSRMSFARSVHQAGQIDGDAYAELRAKFSAVHQWAVEHLGEQALSESVRNPDTHDYRPPVAEPDAPAHGNGKPSFCGSADAVAIVDAIAENALALGWKRDRLYGAGHGKLFNQDRGLVSLLKPGDRIGQVTLKAIEIIGAPPAEVRQSFYNPDVDQPWIRRVTTQISGC